MNIMQKYFTNDTKANDIIETNTTNKCNFRY